MCTDNVPAMLGKNIGMSTLLQKYLNHSLLKYHCIIHQYSSHAQYLTFSYAMDPVVKRTNKIKACGSSNQKFKGYY